MKIITKKYKVFNIADLKKDDELCDNIYQKFWLESEYNITYSKLVEDNDNSLRIHWLNKYGTRSSRIPDTIDENGLLINDIVVDQLSRIWVGTNYGIFIVDKNDMMLTRASFKSSKYINPNNTEALSFEIDHIGNIWIRTVDDGLFKILPSGVNNFDVEHYQISNKRIFSIKEYENKYMLLGSENDGLFFVSFDGKFLKRYLRNQKYSIKTK